MSKQRAVGCDCKRIVNDKQKRRRKQYREGSSGAKQGGCEEKRTRMQKKGERRARKKGTAAESDTRRTACEQGKKIASRREITRGRVQRESDRVAQKVAQKRKWLPAWK
jgi:hypothetical protein